MSDAPDEFEGYDQRPCPKCGHQEAHMPIDYTETMLAQCGECRYEFIKRPQHLETLEIDATPNSEIQKLVNDWRGTAAMKHSDEKDVFNARCDAWRKAADELEALIDDTQAGDADE